MSSSSKPLDPKLFHPSSFQSLGAAEMRFAELKLCMSKDTILQAIENLSQYGLKVVGLFLSGADEHHFQWLLQRFPSDYQQYTSSMFPNLLSQFADFFSFTEVSGVDAQSMAEFRNSVQGATEKLNALSSLEFLDNDIGDDAFPANDSHGKKPKPITQRQKKQARKKARSTAVIDPKLFDAWKIPVPHTKQQAQDAEASILSELKTILEIYLSSFQGPNITDTLKQAFITAASEEASRTRLPRKITPDQTSPTSPASGDMSSSSRSPDVPVAYPTVQPLKSALHFESIEGFGNWRILISGRADRDLREARKKDANSFRIIIKKIKELSCGHFSDDNQKRLNGAGPDVPIFEAKMTRDARLVYQIDCIEDFDSKFEIQVIRIFGIYTHAQLDHNRFWDSLARQIGKKGKKYRDKCAYRLPQVAQGDKIFEPASFPPREESEDPALDPLILPKEDLEELHALLILEKFITFSRPVLNSIIADIDATFPFDLSPREMKIIEHPSSCYVLGRSGTGKTTTMLFRMICVEASYDILNASTRKPRQLFVTHSRILATKVGEYFSKITTTLNLASQTLQELSKSRARGETLHADVGMVDQEEEVLEFNLPARFSELRDEHFPLFITYDQLCAMLEADFAEMNIPRHTGSFVSYRRFLNEYWAHFPQSLTKRLDPALVFSEIMGVIKGSEKTLSCSEWSLDQSVYKDLSHRAFSTFADHRDVIYDVFLSYSKHKRMCGDYDVADKTHSILRAMREKGVPGHKIDYLYVDEVQDNLLIDALVLRSICSNPGGLFWAGDTAQTISVGSSFRFNELKSLLFRIEKKRRRDGQPEPEKPKSFQLAINYRSHGGIVNCAHSVVQLIMRFWPDAIDTLQAEHGVIDGTKPVFFNGCDKDTVRYEQFLFGESGHPIEFGAQQCILVRDDDARDKLREQVGDIGIIMSIYDSKGLEFNDVLLYNFFEDSAVELSRWRVVLNALEGQLAPDIEARHISICTELKCLYVSITRARKNVWIADCSNKGDPMRLFWTHHGLIQNCTPNDVPSLAVGSTKEEWANQGRALFDNRKYFQAKHCYDRASMHREATVADAYFLREQARKLPASQMRRNEITTFETAYLLAAERFLDCARNPPSAKNRRQYFHNAADCFETGRDLLRAAESYCGAEEFTMSCKLYRKLGMFRQAVDIIKVNKTRMDPGVVDSIMDVARLFYLTNHNLECVLGCQPCRQTQSVESCELFGKANDLFSSPEEELEYMEDRDLDVARAIYMASLPGKLAEAAEIHLAGGRTVDAIQLLLQDEKSQKSLRRGCESLVQGLWHHMSFGVSVTSTSLERGTLLTLLSLTNKIDENAINPLERMEITMFRTIAKYSSQGSILVSKDLLLLGAEFYRLNNYAAALLCFDHCFTEGTYMHNLRTPDLAEVLSHFRLYTKLLHEITFDRNPCRSKAIQKLFGIEKSNENVFYVRHDTFLGAFVLADRVPILQATEEGFLITDSILAQAFRKALRERLRSSIHAEDTQCRRLSAFSPCLSFAVFNECRRPDCNNEHRSDTKEIYNQRLRMHLLQISICNVLNDVEPGRHLVLKGHWIGRLYEALNPPYHSLGTVFAVDKRLIPGADQLFAVVRTWLSTLVYDLGHSPDPYFITNLMRNMQLAFALDRNRAELYAYRARCMMDPPDRQPPEFIRPAGVGHIGYIVADLVGCLYGRKVWSLYGGILFLKNVIDKRMPVNLSVLCDFIEFLCASLVVHNAYRRGGVLHDVTLPLSWLAKALQLKFWELEIKQVPFNVFTDSVVALLEPLYNGANHDILWHSGSRNIFIARICKVLCLLGWNIRVVQLRQRIFHGITALRKEDRRFSWLFSNYVNAPTWDHLARAFKQSINTSVMDEVVQIVHARRPVGYPVPGIRRIVHLTGDDILRLVDHALLYPKSALSTTAAPFVPALQVDTVVHDERNGATTTHQPHKADSLAAAEPVPGDDQSTESLQDATVNTEEASNNPNDSDNNAFSAAEPELKSLELEDADEAASTAEDDSAAEMPEDDYVTNTEEEIRAAAVIQALYRRWLIRRRKASSDGSDEALQHFYRANLQVSLEKDWSSRLHRMMYLGPLVHIQLCLEGLHTHTRSLKEKMKIRLRTAKHEELESIGPRLTLINGTFKTAQRLQKALEAKSVLDQGASIRGLKTTVRECEELVRKISHLGVPQPIMVNLELGVKGILKEAPPEQPKPKQLPGLVMDTFDDIWDD